MKFAFWSRASPSTYGADFGIGLPCTSKPATPRSSCSAALEAPPFVCGRPGRRRTRRRGSAVGPSAKRSPSHRRSTSTSPCRPGRPASAVLGPADDAAVRAAVPRVELGGGVGVVEPLPAAVGRDGGNVGRIEDAAVVAEVDRPVRRAVVARRLDDTCWSACAESVSLGGPRRQSLIFVSVAPLPVPRHRSMPDDELGGIGRIDPARCGRSPGCSGRRGPCRERELWPPVRAAVHLAPGWRRPTRRPRPGRSARRRSPPGRCPEGRSPPSSRRRRWSCSTPRRSRPPRPCCRRWGRS